MPPSTEAFAPFVPWLASMVVGSVIAIVGYVFARKSGLGDVQARKSQALEDTNEALEQRVTAVEARAKDAELRADRAEARATRAETRVKRLERTVVALAEENDFMRRQLKMPPRRSPILVEEGDVDD